MVGKSQACDECCRLKIQCSLVPAGGRQGLKQKVESDSEETVQPKWLKLFVEVLRMRGELTMWDVLLEQSELLRELHDLQVKQLEVAEKHLEEAKGARWLISAILFAMEELVEQVAWLEGGSGSGNGEARSI